MSQIPDESRWLFWEMDVEALELQAHDDYILARVLEFGRLTDVRWIIRVYGMPRIHQFFREVGHPEISARTTAFWRAVLNAEHEVWKQPPAWRKTSSIPWID